MVSCIDTRLTAQGNFFCPLMQAGRLYRSGGIDGAAPRALLAWMG
jgi:hypothetical protein